MWQQQAIVERFSRVASLCVLIFTAGCGVVHQRAHAPDDAATSLPTVHGAAGRCAGLAPETLRVHSPDPPIHAHATEPGTPFGSNRTWYRNSEAIEIDGERYVTFGFMLEPVNDQREDGGLEIVRSGTVDGVPYYLPLDAELLRSRMRYVLADAACRVRPYIEVSRIQNVRPVGR
jgi:hypothetical protein